MLPSSAHRISLLLFAASLWLPMAGAGAQDSEEPIPPPLFSERSHEEVERFLAQAPTDESSRGKPGLRVFTISQIEPADVLALLVAGCASLFLVAPGAFLIYASLEQRPLSCELLRSGIA